MYRFKFMSLMFCASFPQYFLLSERLLTLKIFINCLAKYKRKFWREEIYFAMERCSTQKAFLVVHGKGVITNHNTSRSISCSSAGSN
jgi:hypothetical protein